MRKLKSKFHLIEHTSPHNQPYIEEGKPRYFLRHLLLLLYQILELHKKSNHWIFKTYSNKGINHFRMCRSWLAEVLTEGKKIIDYNFVVCYSNENFSTMVVFCHIVLCIYLMFILSSFFPFSPLPFASHPSSLLTSFSILYKYCCWCLIL